LNGDFWLLIVILLLILLLISMNRLFEAEPILMIC
jgi:hypothetical protein